jgi:hypothetical protein
MGIVFKCVIFALSFTSISSLAAGKKDPIDEVMTHLGETVQDMMPLLYDENLSSDPQKEEQLKSYFTKLNTYFDQSKPHFAQRTRTYGISYDVMQQYLTEIDTALKEKKYKIAQTKLKAVPAVCITCHTQDNNHNKLFKNVNTKQFTNQFDLAEFYFATRNYEKALESYNKFLNKPDKTTDTENDINTSLEKILVIYAQIYKNPALGAQKLSQYLSLTTLSQSAKLAVQEWVKGLNEIADKMKNEKNFQGNAARHFVSDYVKYLQRNNNFNFTSEKEKVYFVMLRGWLYEYLNSQPDPEEIPIILYWLAQCDRALNSHFFYSLADLYLKECMLVYPQHPYAQKCFRTYKEYIEFSYSGSSGMDLPSDVKNELENLREIIENGKHSQ